MNPVVPRNILFLTMMIIVCFFACSMAKKREESTTLKYLDKDDVSCGKDLKQVCCPVVELPNPSEAAGPTNEATNPAGRAGCLCRCEVPPINEIGTPIELNGVPQPGYCPKDKGGWVPPTEASEGGKKAARKYKKL